MTARPGSSASTPGTVGKQEHGQVGVFLADAAPGGVALVDRDLYLPKSWTDDRVRCRLAGVPEEVGFQTKPQLGQAMVERALATGVPFGWVTGDTVYGGDRQHIADAAGLQFGP